LFSSQILSMRSVSGRRRQAIWTVHGLVYALGSSMVTSMSMCPIFGRVNRSVMRRASVPGSPRMSSQVLPFCPIVSTTNVDIAVEAGAKFVIVVNPLVPYVNDFQKVIPTMLGSRVRRVADMGFPQVGYQAFKLLAHQRLHEAVKHWREKYPGVDIILIEPDPNDELMFETNILNFTRRVEIARHGFESVTLKLAQDYDELKATCAKHGIDISATRVRKVVKKFAEEREKTAAWRRILEQTTGALLRQSGQA